MQRSLFEVLSTAEYTASKGVTLVTLILAYSAIDGLAWLAANSDDEQVGIRFMRWIDKYMLPAAPAIGCRSEELYAARCAIVHTMTIDSSLHNRKPLRRLVYAWGSGKAKNLQDRIDRSPERGKLVVVHLADLTEGVRLGAANMLEESEKDPRLQGRIRSKQGRFFEPCSAADFGIQE